METKQNSLAWSTAVLTVSSLAAQFMGFIYRIALSRLAGAEVMGLYQLVMPVYAVMSSAAVSGLTVAVSGLSSERQALGDSRGAGQALASALRGLGLIWLPLALTVAVFSDFISVSLLGDARTRLALLILLPVLLLTGVENLHKHYFYGQNNALLPAGVELGEQLIRMGAALGLLWAFLPLDPEGTVGLITLGMLASEIFSACALILLRRGREGALSRLPGRGMEPGETRRQLVRLALPVGSTALLGDLLSAATSVLVPRGLVAGGMDNSGAMSVFGVMFGMTLPMLTLPTAFVAALDLALLPRLRRCLALGRWRECREKVEKAVLATTLIVLPAITLMVMAGPGLGRLLFGSDGVGEHILPLGIVVALDSYRMVLNCVLNGLGRQHEAAVISLLCGGVQLAFTGAGRLWPALGLRPFLTGLAVSSALGLAAALWRVSRCFRVRA